MSDTLNHPATGPDHSDRPFAPAIYFQTTDFTCGPASLMMAMAALDPAYVPGRLEELRIWREANLCFMGEGLAGCGPYGLACAALRRSYAVDIYESNADDLFKIWTRNDDEARVQSLLDQHDRKQALASGCAIHQERLNRDLIERLIDQDRQLITLTSQGVEAHWVIVHDLLDSNVFIIDPYKAEAAELEKIYHTDTGRNFIHYRAFEDWIKYGPQESTVLIALGPRKQS